MKKYTVNDVAKMLKTNPETVRRWIRNGKLEAIQVSRKEGNIITEQMLKTFLKNTPKYALLASTLYPVAGVTALTIALLSSGIAKEIISRNENNIPKVQKKEMIESLKKEISKRKYQIIEEEEHIRMLQEDIEKANEEIEKEKEEIEQMQQLILDIQNNNKKEEIDKE